jgi:hypothetical protein
MWVVNNDSLEEAKIWTEIEVEARK